jgi:hypothetical protein
LLQSKEKTPFSGHNTSNMSSEKIQLPSFLIADLYKDCLVEFEREIAEPKTSQKEKPKAVVAETVVHHAKTLQYLGDNKKNIIILVNQPGAAIINDNELAFLMNVLKACSLTLSDIAIINIVNQEVLFILIKEQLETQKIILFDVTPASINLPFSIPDFQVHQYAGCTILTAPSLAVLNLATEDSRVQKSKLWTSLKQMFNI